MAIMYLDQNVMSVLQESKGRRAKKEPPPKKGAKSKSGTSSPMRSDSPLRSHSPGLSPNRSRDADLLDRDFNEDEIDDLPPQWVEKFRTDIVHGDTNPIYNDTFTLSSIRYDLILLRIEVYHQSGRKQDMD